MPNGATPISGHAARTRTPTRQSRRAAKVNASPWRCPRDRRHRRRDRGGAMRVIEDRPDEEAPNSTKPASEKADSRCAEGPGLHAGHHRMPDRGLDPVARHVGGRDQDEREQREHRRRVVHPERRCPQEDRMLSRPREAPDDQRESAERSERVEALPALGPRCAICALRNRRRRCAPNERRGRRRDRR